MKRIVLSSVVLLLLVIPHIVSADTLIVYTSGNEDGRLYSYTGSETNWGTIRGDVGRGVTTNSASSNIGIASGGTSSTWLYLHRAYFEFNTSSIPDDATITSAYFAVQAHATKTNSLGDVHWVITKFSPATNGTAVAGDYDSFEDVLLSDTEINQPDMNIGSYNNFTLNSIGLSNVSKIAYTNFMLRTYDWDVLNVAPTWSSGVTTYSPIAFAEHTTGTPLLQIEYTSGVSAPVASFTANKNFIRIPNLVSVTDTSSNTPTSWEWSWGDGSANSTTQNPSHQYLKRGKFPIVLTATNAGGSGSTSAYNVRVAGYEN